MNLFGYDLKTIPKDWRTAYIPKKSGGKRMLRIPNDQLKEAQKALLQYFYQLRRDRKFRVSAAAHGFLPHKSCMTAIVQHDKKSEIFLVCDIEGFFDHITADRVQMHFLDAEMDPDWAATVTDVCQCDGVLPQGSPTSPFLTNVVMVDADCQIMAYAKKHGFYYTRYADDLTFSMKNPPKEVLDKLRKSKGKSKNPYLWFLYGVEKILKETLNLNLNHKKDHIIYRGEKVKPHILGVCIRQDGNGYNATPKYRRTTRARICNLYNKVVKDQNGKPEYDDFKEWASVKGAVRYMDGVRAYSEPTYDGNDPKIQPKYWCKLEALLDGAAVPSIA